MNQEVIICDDREPDSAVPRLQSFGFAAISGRLIAGDFAFFPHGLTAGIERKTMSNLLQSLADKQLVGQAHKMIETYDVSFLLREGAFRRSPGGAIEYYSPRDPRQIDGWVLSGWSWDSFQGIMIDLQMMGLRIIDCPVLGEYVVEIARLVTNLCRDEHRWIKDRQRPDVITIDKQWRNNVWSLAAYDGIGTETAEALLMYFGSAQAAVNAVVNQPELAAKVPIGKGPKPRAVGRKAIDSLRKELMTKWTG